MMLNPVADRAAAGRDREGRGPRPPGRAGEGREIISEQAAPRHLLSGSASGCGLSWRGIRGNGPIDPDLLLRAYSDRRLPDVGQPRRARRLLGRAAPARDPAARRLPSLALAAQDAALGPLHGHARPGLRRGRSAAAPTRRRDLDQRRDRGELSRPARARPRPFDRGLGRTARWSAASTASGWAAPSSARACSRRAPTPRRWRSPGWWRG